MKWLRLLSWHWRHLKLMVRAATVWGCHPTPGLSAGDGFADLEQQMLATPLKYELLKLQEEYARITGKCDFAAPSPVEPIPEPLSTEAGRQIVQQKGRYDL